MLKRIAAAQQKADHVVVDVHDVPPPLDQPHVS